MEYFRPPDSGFDKGDILSKGRPGISIISGEIYNFSHSNYWEKKENSSSFKIIATFATIFNIHSDKKTKINTA